MSPEKVVQPFPSASSMRPASLGVQSTLKRVQLDVTVRTGRLATAGVEALSSLFNLEVRLAALFATCSADCCRFSLYIVAIAQRLCRQLEYAHGHCDGHQMTAQDVSVHGNNALVNNPWKQLSRCSCSTYLLSL